MPTVSFTQNLKRHLACDTATVGGATLAEALDEVFKNNPAMRGYILDDQGAVRKHVAIYLNNQTIADRATLTDTVEQDDEIYIMQALSGG